MNGTDLCNRIDSLLAKHNKKRGDLYVAIPEVTSHSMYDWIRRNTIPAADIVYKIAQYLNTTMEWLLTGKESNEYKIRCDELIESMQNIQESIQNAIDHYNNG